MVATRSAGKVNPRTTAAYKALTKKFGKDLDVSTLVELADDAVTRVDGLGLPNRAARKSLNSIYLWFDANWDVIEGILDDLGSNNRDEEEEEEEEAEEGNDSDDQDEDHDQHKQDVEGKGKSE
jgi:hypothetical protein